MNRFGVLFLTLALSSIFSFTSWAIEPILVEIKPEADGTYTYVYKIKIDGSILVKGGTEDPNPDFFTIYNFGGLVDDSAKQPEGWKFSSSTNGTTPIRGGRTVINPLDIRGIPNVTWSRVGPDLTATEITGFSVRTGIKETMKGEYGSQVTRKLVETSAQKLGPPEAKEARIGSIMTPKLLKSTGATR